MRPGTILIVALITASCTQNTSTGPSALPASHPAATAADLAFCVQQMNSYRTPKNLPLLVQSAALEAHAFESARADALSGIKGQYFRTHPGPAAQIMTLRQSLPLPNRSIGFAFYLMGADYGYPTPHPEQYAKIVGPYTHVGCGAFAQGDQITSVVNFR